MGVPQNRWFFNGKSHENGLFRGTPYFRKPPNNQKRTNYVILTARICFLGSNDDTLRGKHVQLSSGSED